MESRRIKFTIYLVSLALLFLIVVQIFWAYSSFRLREETVQSHVMDAMREAVERTNQQLNAMVLFSKTKLQPGEAVFIVREHSAKQLSHKRNIILDTVQLFTESACEMFPFSLQGMMVSDVVNMETVIRFTAIEDSVEKHNTSLRYGKGITLENYREKFADKVPMYKKYDTAMVELILRNSLASRSINNRAFFAYINTDKNTLEYANAGADTAKFWESTLRYRLTDNEYFTQRYDLVVYLENNDALILSGIRQVLILSALVVAALLLSFFLFIRIVQRQRKLSELKNDFVNNMTHEFKTPLANISLALETLSEQRVPHTTANSPLLKIVGQETERLHDNIEKILQVARFEQERIHLSFERMDVHQTIYNAVSCFEVALSARQGTVQCQLQAQNALLLGDETHILNMIANLIDNAIKYSPHTPDITITTWNTSEGIWIRIKDKGRGISKEAQKSVFEKFYREPEGNTHTIKGFGLGLTYVKSIVEFHRGKILLRSQHGIGSEFDIFLPFKQ